MACKAIVKNYFYFCILIFQIFHLNVTFLITDEQEHGYN